MMDYRSIIRAGLLQRINSQQHVTQSLGCAHPGVPHGPPRLNSGPVGLAEHYNGRPVGSDLPMPVAPPSVSATPPTRPISDFPFPGLGRPSGDSPLPPLSALGDSSLCVTLPPLDPELLKRVSHDSESIEPPNIKPRYEKKTHPNPTMSPAKQPPTKKQRTTTGSTSKQKVPDQSNVKSPIDELEMIRRLGITPEKYKQISGRKGFNLTFDTLAQNDGEHLTRLIKTFGFTPDQLVRILNADYTHARIEFILKSDVVPFLLNRGFGYDDIAEAFSHVGSPNRFKKLMADAPGLSKYIHVMDDTIGHIISPNKALDIFNALIRSGVLNKTGDLTPNGLGVFEYLSSNLKNSFNLTDDQITHIQSVVAHGSTRFDTIAILLPEKQHLQHLFFNRRSMTPDNIDWLFTPNSDGQPLNIDKLLKVIRLLSTGIEKNNDIIKKKYSERLFNLCRLLAETTSADFFKFLLEPDPRSGQSPLESVLHARNFDMRSIVKGAFLKSDRPFAGVPVSLTSEFKEKFEEYYNEMIKFKGHVDDIMLAAGSMT